MKKWDAWLVQGLAVLVLGIAVLQTVGADRLSGVLFDLTFPLTVALWLRSVRETVTWEDVCLLMTVAVAVACVLLGAVIHGTGAGFDYWKKPIMFMTTLLYFQAASRLRADAGLKAFVGRGIMLAAVVFLAMFLLRREEMYTIAGVPSAYLTFGFTNPNLATLFLAMMAMLLFCRARETKRWYYAVAAVWMAVFVVLTGARNAMLALAVFGLLCLLRWERVRVPGLWTWMPLVFAVAYLLLLPAVQPLLHWLGRDGKALDSRWEIWQQAWQALTASPLLGGYDAVSQGTGMFQMHNSHLDLAVSYGVPVLVLVCVLLRRWLKYCRGVYAPAAVGAVLLGCAEAAVFSGGLGIYILAGLPLLLAKEEMA